MKEMKIALIDVPLMIAVCMLTMFFVQNDIRQKTARIDTTYRQSMRPTHNQLVDLSLKLRRHVLHRDATRAESVSQFTDMENQYTDLFAKVSTLTPPDAKVSQYGMLQAAPNGCTHGINGMAEEIEGGRTISSGFEDARDEFRRCSDAITALLWTNLILPGLLAPVLLWNKCAYKNLRSRHYQRPSAHRRANASAQEEL